MINQNTANQPFSPLLHPLKPQLSNSHFITKKEIHYLPSFQNDVSLLFNQDICQDNKLIKQKENFSSLLQERKSLGTQSSYHDSSFMSPNLDYEVAVPNNDILNQNVSQDKKQSLSFPQNLSLIYQNNSKQSRYKESLASLTNGSILMPQIGKRNSFSDTFQKINEGVNEFDLLRSNNSSCLNQSALSKPTFFNTQLSKQQSKAKNRLSVLQLSFQGSPLLSTGNNPPQIAKTQYNTTMKVSSHSFNHQKSYYNSVHNQKIQNSSLNQSYSTLQSSVFITNAQKYSSSLWRQTNSFSQQSSMHQSTTQDGFQELSNSYQLKEIDHNTSLKENDQKYFDSKKQPINEIITNSLMKYSLERQQKDEVIPRHYCGQTSLNDSQIQLSQFNNSDHSNLPSIKTTWNDICSSYFQSKKHLFKTKKQIPRINKEQISANLSQIAIQQPSINKFLIVNQQEKKIKEQVYHMKNKSEQTKKEQGEMSSVSTKSQAKNNIFNVRQSNFIMQDNNNNVSEKIANALLFNGKIDEKDQQITLEKIKIFKYFQDKNIQLSEKKVMFKYYSKQYLPENKIFPELVCREMQAYFSVLKNFFLRPSVASKGQSKGSPQILNEKESQSFNQSQSVTNQSICL